MAQKLTALKEKLGAVLAARLGGFRSELHRAELADRILGHIVSSDFEGMEYPARQALFREIVDSELTPGERAMLGPIILFTPAEVHVKESA